MIKPLELAIGLRYTRARRRNHFISFITLISVLGIALGVTALITVLSVMNGFERELQSRILGFAADVTVQQFTQGLSDWRAVAAKVRPVAGVTGMAPYVQGQTMLTAGRAVSGAVVRGIDPHLEGAVSQIGKDMLVGSLKNLTPGHFGIVLGKDLATYLGVGLGDPVTVITSETNVTPVGILPRFQRFTVAGIFSAGMYQYDRGMAFIDLRDAQRLLQLGHHRITGLRIKVRRVMQAPAVSTRIQKLLGPDYWVTDWTRENANFFHAVRTEKTVMFVILFLIVAVGVFNIVSTLVMVINDKRADIAILRTLGMPPGQIMRIFIIQGSVIGLVGVLIGIGSGVALSLNVETIVPMIEHLFHVQFLSPKVYYISQLPSYLEWSDVWHIGLIAFVLAVLATLYPARRAAHTQPAEALRYE